MSSRSPCNVNKCRDANGTDIDVDVNLANLKKPKNKPYIRIAIIAVLAAVTLIIFFQPDLGLLPTEPLQGGAAFAIDFLLFTLLGFGIGITFVIVIGIAVKKKKK